MVLKYTSIFLVIMSAFLIQACAGKIINTSEEKANTEVPTAESLVRGQALYENYCLQCHGPEGKGDGEVAKKANLKVADLTEEKKHVTRFGILLVIEKPHFSKFTMIRQVKHPVGKMPEVKDDLTRPEMDDLVGYIKTLIYK